MLMQRHHICPPPTPSHRFRHPSTPPSSHSQPLLPRPATCSLIPLTPSPPPTTRPLGPPPVRSSTPLQRLRHALFSFTPPLPPFPSLEAARASLAVHQFLLEMGPPGGGRRGSPPVRVVSVWQCGSARLCFALRCVGREGLAMTLLCVRKNGRRLMCWRRAWLLCWLVLCDSWAALLMVPGACLWVVHVGGHL